MSAGVPAERVAGTVGPTPDSITYRFVGYRLLTFVVFVPLGIAGIAMLVNLVAGGTGPPAAFVAFWLAAYGWNVYWWLFRIAYEVGVVQGSNLRWRGITTTRDVPLVRVNAIRTPFPPFGVGLKMIVIDGDRSPLMIATRGYSEVVAMIVQFRPDIVVPNTWYDRTFRRFSKGAVRWRRV